MTRRGSPEERRWRRWRNMETGSDGSIHGEQPVDPRGRHPREKPSGHRHTEDQPPEEHGSGKHDSTVADDPHGQGAHDSTVAANPHGNATHSPGMVENPTSSAPSLRRGDRASQPTPSNVAVGSRYVVEDEQEVEEVAADTTGDNAADTWLVVGTDPTHNHDSRYVNETGDTMSGALNVDRGGTGRVELTHGATDDIAFLRVHDDSGNLVEHVIFGPTHAEPRHELRGGDVEVTAGNLKTTHGLLPTQFAVASDSRQENIDNSDFQANATNDHVTIQNAIDALPVGTK